jgi:hypothetical protein
MLSTSAISPRRPALTNSRRRLLLAVGGLLALDVVGGRSPSHTVSTPLPEPGAPPPPSPPGPDDGRPGAPGPRRDPLPDRRGATAAGLLAAASLISGISGFFDGQLARPDMPAPLIGFQCLLVAATLTVSGLAIAHLLCL